MFGIDDLISGVLAALNPVLVHYFPDPAKRFEAETAIRRIDWQIIQGQIEVNKVEAASPNVFVSGGRPAVIWVGAAGLAWQFILAPLLGWIATLFAPGIPLPVLGGPDLTALVAALLGVAGMRSYDKKTNATNGDKT